MPHGLTNEIPPSIFKVTPFVYPVVAKYSAVSPISSSLHNDLQLNDQPEGESVLRSSPLRRHRFDESRGDCCSNIIDETTLDTELGREHSRCDAIDPDGDTRRRKEGCERNRKLVQCRLGRTVGQLKLRSVNNFWSVQGITHRVAGNNRLNLCGGAGNVNDARGSTITTGLCALDEKVLEGADDKEWGDGVEREYVHPVMQSFWPHPRRVSAR